MLVGDIRGGASLEGLADWAIGDNNLSFIETSALDASNVELAFQNILTGMLPLGDYWLYGAECANICVQKFTA